MSSTFYTQNRLLPLNAFFSLKTYLPFLVALLFLTGCGPDDTSNAQTKVFDVNLSAQMKKALDTSLQEHNITGAVLAVRSPDDATWKDVSGYSIDENSTPMSTDLYFRIGSITKTFTSTLTLMLIDNGVLSLDTTVNEVVPDLNVLMGDIITIKDLLDMRSGLEKYLANSDFAVYFTYDPGRIWAPEEIIPYANIKTSDPDTTFLYNNSNYVILGLIIERLTGETYPEALQQYILNPLGLHHTLMPPNGNMPEPFANGYQYNTDGNMTENLTYYLNPSIAWSAGGLISNADDLLVWSKAYLSGSLLTTVSHQEQFTLQAVSTTENPVISGYGFGAMQDGILIGHDGFIPPYGSWVAKYKDYNFVLLINGTRNSDQEPVFAATTVLTDVINAVDSQL